MIGIDIVRIKRIEKFYMKHGIKGYERFLRPEEIALVGSPKTAAGFWCLKEATAKALGCGISSKCGFYDIWIHKDELGKPYISLSKHIIAEFKIRHIDASITHDGGFAVGVVVFESAHKSKVLSH